MLKITLIIYVKKVKKGLDNNAQFELKILQFYVFQGKKKIKTTLIKRPKSRKTYSIKERKNTEIYEDKKLSKTDITGLKIRKSGR